jgi:hypothetical protein
VTIAYEPPSPRDLLTPQERHTERAVEAFTRLGAAPRATFPLALASVTIAVLALHADLVAKYSASAFWAGIVATVVLAIGVGHAMSVIRTPRARMLAALVLPAVGGAIVGVIVQAMVLHTLTRGDSVIALKDLGGLVDSTEPVSWLVAGVFLGALPALAVSVFLMLAARALRRLVGNDAAEGFGVAFTGGAGLLAALSLAVVETWEMLPLFVVISLASFSVLLAFLVDGARLGFLRHVWAGVANGATTHARMGYEVVPADRFRHDPSLAPMVAQAGVAQVLVRVDRRIGSYRAAAAEPIAMLADTEAATLRPLLRRRTAAVAILVGIAVVTGLTTMQYLDDGSKLGASPPADYSQTF